MERLSAGALAALLRLENEVIVFVLAAFLGLGAAAVLRAVLGERLLPQRQRRGRGGRWRRAGSAAGYLGLAVVMLGLGVVYGTFVLARVEWHVTTMAVAAITLAGVFGGVVVRRVTGLSLPAGPTGILIRVVVVLSLVVLALVTLMRAGFLSLTEDRPVLLVEVTGRTGTQLVSWAPPGGAMRSETLVTHEVVFRRPADQAIVGDVWVYGDQVAVQGRVLRLSPILNAAGVPNLLELTFAHNGYRTLDRHNTMPHTAFALDPLGPLAVHPLWHRWRARLLDRWEKGTGDDSMWMVRSSTTESTFFPLVDSGGKSVTHVFRLVLTPGGLSSS